MDKRTVAKEIGKTELFATPLRLPGNGLAYALPRRTGLDYSEHEADARWLKPANKVEALADSPLQSIAEGTHDT